jgi:hypothetical protein
MSIAKRKKQKPPKRKSQNSIVVLRGCLTMLAEICGIAGFLLALYIFIREYL